MPKIPNQLYATQNFHNEQVSFTALDAISPKTIFTAAPNDSLIYNINATSSAIDPHIIYLYLNGELLGHGVVAPGAGHDEDKRIAELLFNLNLPTDANGNRFFPLMGGSVLSASMKVVLGTAETITITVFGEDY